MAYTVNIYDQAGKVSSTITLDDAIFGHDSVSPSLIHEYYLLQTANARIVRSHTKTRWEVSGSGKKLYKQKGTGSARVGDKRSPIRIKGGIVFGPRKERNFSKDMPKKAKKLALYGLLSLRAKDSEILWFNADFKEPKTKLAVDLITNIWLKDNKLLIVLEASDEAMKKSFRNIDRVKYIQLEYLNPYDILNCDKLLFTESALKTLNTIKKA